MRAWCWTPPARTAPTRGLRRSSRSASRAPRTPGSATATWPRSPASARRATGDHEVVEDRGREPGLQERAVDALQRDVAVVGVLAPGHRHALGVGRGLQRPVRPAEPVGQQLLAADADVLEARGPRVGG